jgi:glyoxylase-like metal-dependent hydrolase (beta-lactamase superfamily II)
MSQLSRRSLLKGMAVLGAATAVSTVASVGGTTRRVKAQGFAGASVFTTTRGNVTLHSYVAPNEGFLVTTHIIETEKSLVVVDSQFAQSQAKAALELAKSTGKPINRVILSHSHPDHWGGLNVFAGAPVYAAAGVQAAVAKNAQGTIDSLGASFGDEFTKAVPVIENTLVDGQEVIDGVTFDFKVYKNAEDAEQVVIRLPEAGVIVLQDLLYSAAYAFPGLDRENWIKILTEIRDGQGYDLALPGHGFPARISELTNSIKYLAFFNAARAKSTTPDELNAALQAEYPGYGAPGILGFTGLAFQ